jgi:hypothetical protein
MGVKRRVNPRAPLSQDFLALNELVKRKIGFKTVPQKKFRVSSLTVTRGISAFYFLAQAARGAPVRKKKADRFSCPLVSDGAAKTCCMSRSKSEQRRP